MSHAELTAAQWQECTDEQAARIAQEIATRHELRLVPLRWHRYAGRAHRVALFDRAGLALALVPGGRAVLGYDGGRFRPAPAQAASYAETAEEEGLPALAEFLDVWTSPVRSAELPAMLVAVEALEPCGSGLDPGDPRVRELVAQVPRSHRGGGTMTFHRDGGLGVKVRFDTAGRVAQAREMLRASYEEAVGRVAGLGLRLSTPDEWEYACGAGAQTLFRWGDDTPGSGYPCDHLTGPHREANLWGLAIGQDPDREERTSERAIVCGGDGGGMTCGGHGFFLGWVTIATAYREPELGAGLDSQDGYVGELLVRPVIDLA